MWESSSQGGRTHLIFSEDFTSSVQVSPKQTERTRRAGQVRVAEMGTAVGYSRLREP